MESDQLLEAMALYEEAYALYPEKIDIAKEYMVCLRKLGYIQRSIKIGWESVERKSTDGALWQNLGNSFLQAHAWDAAMDAYKMASKYTKDKMRISLTFINLGFEQYYNGAYDNAIKSFASALEINKDDGLALAGMGAAQCAKGDKKTGKDNIYLGIGLVAMGKKQHPSELMGKLKGALESENCTVQWQPWLSYQLIPTPFLIQPAQAQAANLVVEQSINRRYTMPDYGFIEITTPEHWSEALNGKSQGLFTIDFRSAKQSFIEFLFTVIKPEKNIDAEKNKDFALAMGNKMLTTSVEQEIILREVKSEKMQGYVFLLTDKKFADKEIPKGEFKYSLCGSMITGSYLITITVLTNDRDESLINELTKIIESIAYHSAK